MARLIDADALEKLIRTNAKVEANDTQYDIGRVHGLINAADLIHNAPTVDAVEVVDPELRKAIKMLIKQYEHSKNSEYVHSPIAHAFYHTWKQLERDGNGRL